MPNRAPRRSNVAKYPTSLDNWSHDRLLVGLELPAVGSGPPRLVDFMIPSLNDFARQGEIPNPLAQIALRSEWEPTFSVVQENGDDDERRMYYELMCWVIASQLRKPDLRAEFDGDLAAAAAWVSENIHDEQKIAMWERCQHIFASEDVLRMIRLVGEEVAKAEQEEVKGSDVSMVADLGDFRDGSPGADQSGRGAAAGEVT